MRFLVHPVHVYRRWLKATEHSFVVTSLISFLIVSVVLSTTLPARLLSLISDFLLAGWLCCTEYCFSGEACVLLLCAICGSEIKSSFIFARHPRDGRFFFIIRIILDALIGASSLEC